MEKRNIVCDFCVIGGGMAGVCAAISAARQGLKVALVQDRNVLGGNASSEIRMWIRGAGLHFPEWQESGLIEELALDNMHYNPEMNYSLWDGVLYNKVVAEKNIRLLLGATCIGASYENNKIRSIRVWHLQSYIFYEITAKYFADCSGDCILAEFIPAATLCGRESKETFSETLAGDMNDLKTMGNSCLFQLRRTDDEPAPRVPFPFEADIPHEQYANRINFNRIDYETQNFWWLELGGNKDALRDAETINRDLIALSFGAYSDFVKSTDNKSGWTLDWASFLAGKRETRRYEGDYVLTSDDLLASSPFPDEIAYGGWSIDDHSPDGFYALSPNRNFYLDKPYAIPYRCVYSKNVDNLFFAGRNVSVTHLALSSTRVMATCASLGQAVGFAAAIANKYDVSPREVGIQHIDELQTTLLNNDCALLHRTRANRFGFDETERTNATVLKKNERLRFEFPKTYCNSVRLVFDSDLQRTDETRFALKNFPSLCYNAYGKIRMHTPKSLVKDYVLEIKQNGEWKKTAYTGNFQRLVLHDVNAEIEGIAFIGTQTHGANDVRLFSIDIL